MALAVAALIGAGAFYCAEILYDNIRDVGATAAESPMPLWRVHMGAAFAGTVAFVIALFLLETVGRGSRRAAVRSAALWWPVVAVTGAATAVHIPVYLVIATTLVYIPWAYTRTREIH